MAQARFSKTTLAAEVFKRIHRLECDFNFERGNGYAQVTGKGDELNRAYGEFHALLDLAQEFDLSEPVPPAWWTPFARHSARGAGKSRR